MKLTTSPKIISTVSAFTATLVLALSLVAVPASALQLDDPLATVVVKDAPKTAICKQDYPTPCLVPSNKNDVVMKVKFPKRLTEITKLCITTHFGADQFDPGEEFYIDDIGGAVGVDGLAAITTPIHIGHAVNDSKTSAESRQICIVADVTNNYLAGFENVHKELVHFFMVHGSAQVVSAIADVEIGPTL